jgi:hypothetical protein
MHALSGYGALCVAVRARRSCAAGGPTRQCAVAAQRSGTKEEKNMRAPFYPIIYVRGYAMTEGERDETAADPFCGFNTGSTVYRASVNKSDPPRKLVFESPLLRLASDFGYTDVYENGSDIVDDDWQPSRGKLGIPSTSVVIYRYYDSGSTLLGDGEAREIESYASGLNTLILKVRSLVCAQESLAENDFKCYLVAHSMGGLVVRAFLQNPQLEAAEARKAVDKIFTYATPHNGIDLAGINVPRFAVPGKADIFNREHMAQYLGLQDVFALYGRVDFLRESQFPVDRFFCMIGTNRGDYEAAMGLSRAFVGHGSDGLVKIENAGVWGLDAANKVTRTAATAFAFRAHSGYFGIVNSEEAYQNMWRFLFGDVRVDIWLEVESVTLPGELEGKDVDGLYQFEMLARPRGKRWYLSRRAAEEDSPACRSHKQLTQPETKASRKVYLSTCFLPTARGWPAIPTTAPWATASICGCGCRTTKSTEASGRTSYEGSYLFRDQLLIEMEPPLADGTSWSVKYLWESQGLGKKRKALQYDVIANSNLEMEVQLPAPASRPGIQGKVVLIASPWNPPMND